MFFRRKNRFDRRKKPYDRGKKNLKKPSVRPRKKKSLKIYTGFVEEKNGKIAEKVCSIAEKDFLPIVLD